MKDQDHEHDVTAILKAHGRGEPGAFDALFERVYGDLRRIARRQLRGHAAPPLHTGSLVHEVYLKLVDQDRVDWHDRSHFFGVASMPFRVDALHPTTSVSGRNRLTSVRLPR